MMGVIVHYGDPMLDSTDLEAPRGPTEVCGRSGGRIRIHSQQDGSDDGCGGIAGVMDAGNRQIHLQIERLADLQPRRLEHLLGESQTAILTTAAAALGLGPDADQTQNPRQGVSTQLGI